MDSVSVDKQVALSGKEFDANRSVTSLSTVESTMSMATAARTMLAEMGTLRNVRNMQKQNFDATQKTVDTTTWKPSYEAQRRTGTAPAGISRSGDRPTTTGASWYAGLARSNALYAEGL